MYDNIIQPIFSSKDMNEYNENVITLTEIFLNHDGVGTLMKAASSMFGNPLVLLDTAYKLISHYAASPVNESFWEYLITYGHASEEQIMLFETKDIMRNCYESDNPVIINGIKDKISTSLVCKILINHNIVGGFGIIQANKQISTADAKLAFFFSRLLGEELERSEDFHPSDGFIFEQLLYDLLSITPETRTSLEKRIRVFDYHANNKYYAFSIPLDLSQSVSGDYMRNKIREMFPQNHVLFLREKLMIYIIADMNKEQFGFFLKTISSFLHKRNLQCGVSEPFLSLIEFQSNSHCAKCALDIGKKIHPDKVIYLFDNYRIYSFFLESSSSFNIKSYCDQNIYILIEYDSQKGTELFQSLYAYLVNKGNIKLAAEQLFIHRNTLDYRIEKIISLTGWNLNDNSTFFNLLFTCELLEFMRYNEF